MNFYRWELREIDETKIAWAVQRFGISADLVHILFARGITQEEHLEAFLSDDAMLPDPFSFAGMGQAVERIRAAIDENQRIAIYGDYDADGITATVLLYSYFDALGVDVFYYIPDRDGEGYGLNANAIKKMKKAGVSLIITVDNGISAGKEIALAKELGMDVVVTDHHQPSGELPDAWAVVDPHREDCTSPFKSLAGVAVAFMLVCALEDGDCETMLDYYGDLVTIGTIADIMPLIGPNRSIVKHGVRLLSETEHAGIGALCRKVFPSGGELTAENVAFGLAPRINAAGRLGKTSSAVELLLCEEEEEAARLADEVCRLNTERKSIEENILKQIDAKLLDNPDLLQGRAIILWGYDWHHGVIGIAAARVVRKYKKPCILISVEGEEARGSGRGILGMSMFETLVRCKDLLSRYGGHTQAVGFSLPAENLELFREAYLRDLKDHYPLMPVQSLDIDEILPEEQMTIDFIRSLEMLEPFGKGNESPVFAMKDVTLNGIYEMGGGKHLRLRVNCGTTTQYFAYFFQTLQNFPFAVSDRVDLAFELNCNEYNGEERVSAVIRDIRPAGIDDKTYFASRQVYDIWKFGEGIREEDRAFCVPDRNDIAVVYRHIREKRTVNADYDRLACLLQKNGLGYCKLRLSVDILKELELIRENDGSILWIPGKNKVSLENSEIYRSFL